MKLEGCRDFYTSCCRQEIIKPFLTYFHGNNSQQKAIIISSLLITDFLIDTDEAYGKKQTATKPKKIPTTASVIVEKLLAFPMLNCFCPLVILFFLKVMKNLFFDIMGHNRQRRN